MIKGRFTDETDMLMQGKMRVQSDIENLNMVRQRD